MHKKQFLIFTPVNPTRPFYERLRQLHQYNLRQNSRNLYDYIEKEVCLPSVQQSNATLRGQNVVKEFNKVYRKYRKKGYDYICKWDDDIILPRNILHTVSFIFDDDPKVVGVGLFQENYGAPNILMAKPVEDGWYGAFSRFYCYRMSSWGTIPIRKQGGDPDNTFQIKYVKGEKHILDVPAIHLDHRCFTNEQYKVLLDMAMFYTMQF